MAIRKESHVMDINSEELKWKKTFQEKMKSFYHGKEEEKWQKMCIYRLPTFAKKERENALNPQVVSFGPYHHGEDDLKFVEDYKESVLMRFLCNAERPLEDFMNAMEKEFDNLQACYQGLDEKWKDKHRFLRLMITDGCFMLEILRLKPDDTRYAKLDPILGKHGANHILPYITRDMVLLENQIPLQVLKVLLQVEAEHTPKGPMTDQKINELVVKFWEQEDMPEMETLGLHILDLYRIIMIRWLRIPPVYSLRQLSETIPTATELHEYGGVQFKRITNKESISFKDGVLSLPQFCVDDNTECIFLNLMAFEHLHPGVGDDVTSYIVFMDELIDSNMDVHLLYSAGIIHSFVGSESAVVQILNNITKDVTLDPMNNLGWMKDCVNEYSNQKLHRWRARLHRWRDSLMDKYFNNPWSAIALFAAATLLVLTILQTVYAVLGYQKGTNF